MAKQKIKIEELTENSTPCEICVAMNSREIEPNRAKNYFDDIYCFGSYQSKCLDSDKAQIKLLYLLTRL